MTGTREDTSTRAPADRRWLFGAVVLNERTLELSVEGQLADVERKSLQVLLHLLNHAGEVVTKDELIAAVWPGRILSDSVITSCIARLRDALHDDGQTIIKTVHGYGYRLIAPVKVEAAPETAPARFEFKPGEHLPARPLWSLVERLGTGGHGEAWLARHDKTRERRVYKFAADGEALHTLKREITIYRLLHDSLGERPDLVRLLDWNLEEPPYFLEYDYLEAGSLTSWAQAKGGIDRVPLEARIEMAAQIADALGAAHSVGVLHKDLKPSNVLVEPRDGAAPQIKLADFGSGGVLDISKLEQMGITKLGFTQTIGTFGPQGVTPLYLAPEVIAGQPFTVKADIYALGVMLYQLAVGNFHKPLAPGWEQDVPDEVLRSDIAAAADGHPELRIADASRLAQRLRALDERRRKLVAERKAKEEAESAKLQMERMKARRVWVRLALAASVTGVMISSWLYVRAQRAAETTQAVSDFLNNDVLSSADPWKNPIKTMTVKDALDRAAGDIDRRFGDRPEVAARLHATIGTVYQRMQEPRLAVAHLESADALYTTIEGPASKERLAMLLPLGDALTEVGRMKESCSAYSEIINATQGSGGIQLLWARSRLGLCIAQAGDINQGIQQMRAVLADSRRTQVQDQDFLIDLKQSLSMYLSQTDELTDAQTLGREALDELTKKYGGEHLLTAIQRKLLAEVLLRAGKYDEAGLLVEQGLRDLGKWSGDTASQSINFLNTLGAIRIRQKRLDEALAVLQSAEMRGKAAYGDQRPSRLQTWGLLGRTYEEQGHYDEAVIWLKRAMSTSEKLLGVEHRGSIELRLLVASCLRRQGRNPQAWDVLNAVSAKGLEALPRQHGLLGKLLTEKGLLLLADGQAAAGRKALEDALVIYEHAYGADHPLTAEAREDLARTSKGGV